MESMYSLKPPKAPRLKRPEEYEPVDQGGDNGLRAPGEPTATPPAPQTPKAGPPAAAPMGAAPPAPRRAPPPPPPSAFSVPAFSGQTPGATANPLSGMAPAPVAASPMPAANPYEGRDLTAPSLDNDPLASYPRTFEPTMANVEREQPGALGYTGAPEPLGNPTASQYFNLQPTRNGGVYTVPQGMDPVTAALEAANGGFSSVDLMHAPQLTERTGLFGRDFNPGEEAEFYRWAIDGQRNVVDQGMESLNRLMDADPTKRPFGETPIDPTTMVGAGTEADPRRVAGPGDVPEAPTDAGGSVDDPFGAYQDAVVGDGTRRRTFTPLDGGADDPLTTRATTPGTQPILIDAENPGQYDVPEFQPQPPRPEPVQSTSGTPNGGDDDWFTRSERNLRGNIDTMRQDLNRQTAEEMASRGLVGENSTIYNEALARTAALLQAKYNDGLLALEGQDRGFDLQEKQLAQQESQFSRGLAQNASQFDREQAFREAGMSQEMAFRYAQLASDDRIRNATLELQKQGQTWSQAFQTALQQFDMKKWADQLKQWEQDNMYRRDRMELEFPDESDGAPGSTSQQGAQTTGVAPGTYTPGSGVTLNGSTGYGADIPPGTYFDYATQEVVFADGRRVPMAG